MRSFIVVAMAVAMIGVLDARPASAARESWRIACEGSELVCGPTRPATSAYAPKAQKAQKVQKAKTYAKKSTAKKTYAKKPVTVAKSYEDDTVAPKKAKKNASYSSSGSSYSLSGKASYYWQPQRVASGGWFNPNAMTAAHKSLPFGTKVRVTNRNNGKSVVVTINDRGPYIAGRIIDLSKAAAGAISMQGSGVVPVSVAVLGR